MDAPWDLEGEMIETLDTANRQTRRRPTARDTKLPIGGLIVVLTVAHLILTDMRGSTAGYLTA
jgi:hypothetical protein